MAEQTADTNKGDLFSSIGALVGMVAGGPGGAALGGGLGSLLGGGSPEDAIRTGIGSYFNAGIGGKAGMALNALNSFSGGGGSQNQGASGMNLFSGQQGQQGQQGQGFAQQALMGGIQGGPTGALRGILQSVGIEDANGRTDPILGAMLQQFLYDQEKVNFGRVMSDKEQRQYDTGERRPDYTGTVLPGTPRVMTRAMGGMIDGPGTGISDSIPAQIYQNGGPVQEARLSDGEFVMTADAVRGAGGGNRNAGAAKMYQMMNQLERAA